MEKHLCYGCKTFQEVAYLQPGTGHEFCGRCRWEQPFTMEDLMLFALTEPDSPYGPPFRPGDVVEARVAGLLYDGVGVVEDMSMDLEHGATPLYPTFKVRFTEKATDHDVPDSYYYPENCLTKVAATEEARSE